jgi:hypothetical protein
MISLSQKLRPRGGLGMKRALLIALSGALILTLAPVIGWAKKIAPIATRCPEGYTRRIDADKQRDVCVVSEAPACPDRETLREDAAEFEDLCVTENTPPAAGRHPSCAEKLKLIVQEGPDACQKTQKTECRKGFHLKVLPGEDMCVR